MRSIKPFFACSLFIFFAFLLSGCFEYEETITIRQNGSGEMAVHYFGPEDSDITVDGFKLNTKDEEKTREYLERKFSGPGLRLKSCRSYTRGDVQHVNFTVTFEQLSNLARARWWSDQYLDAGQRDGRSYWTRRLKNRDNDWDRDSGGLGEWVKEKVADELADHIKLRFVIETEGNIIETNARDHLPHRVVWRFDGGDLVKPEGLNMQLTWK